MRVSPVNRRSRDDSGVVAVVVALCSLLLLSVAALAVDMGNAWTQRREVQTQADLAALAGGAALPATTSTQRQVVAQKVLTYLRSNATYGQDDGASASWTVAQLQDGSPTNGEITFPTPNQLRVVSPPSTVQFGLAQVMGFDSTDVSAAATVEIRSPGSMMPMWLPSSCAVGSVQGDTASNGQGADTTGTYTPASTDPLLGLTGLSPTTMAYGASAPATVTITNIDPGLTDARVAFSLGSTLVASYPVTFPVTTRKDDTRTVAFTIDAQVSTLPGTWQVWSVQPNLTFSKSSLPFTVEGAGTLGCSPSERGNFGQLDSPRRTGENKQARYALNLAVGVDHSFEAYPAPLPTGGVCGSGLPAKPDTVPQDGRNCVGADPGNDGPGLTDGLLAGVQDAGGVVQPGRLTNSPAGQGCRPPITSAFTKITARPLNNDVLTCFLPPGVGTNAIATAGVPAPPGVLAPSIFESPRLLWVPVVGCGDRGCKGQLAISTFAPCFITDETVGPRGPSSTASATNGITLNGGGTQVSAVTMLCFDPAALPETAVPSGSTTAYTGVGTRVIRLIE